MFHNAAARWTCRALLVLGCLSLIPAPSAMAQSLGLGDAGDKAPIEVLADDGIEWMRDGKRFVARGNASATRGDTTVYADVLTAHYRTGANGKSELWRLDADGHVRIVSPQETATGDHAVYDIDSSVLILTGQPHAQLVTPDTTVTAKDTLEYWSVKRMAVARGNAKVVRDNRTLIGDTITAYFTPKDAPKTKKGKDTNGQIDMIDAHGNVKIVTPTETASGDKGRYNVKTGIATLLDNVSLSRDTDTLRGAYAVVNMNTGVSTLYANRPGIKTDTPTPVRGRFIPKKAEPMAGDGATAPSSKQ